MVRMARPRGHRLNPDALEALLRHAGTTITELADKAGLPRATVSGLLGGHHRASVPAAHKLADAIGCAPGALFPTLRAGFSETDTEAAA